MLCLGHLGFPLGFLSSIQDYFRKHKPPFLAVWGKNDPFFLPPGAEAFKRDIPGAVVRFFDTGHFALETHAREIAESDDVPEPGSPWDAPPSSRRRDVDASDARCQSALHALTKARIGLGCSHGSPRYILA
jgi:hypothetical protein